MSIVGQDSNVEEVINVSSEVVKFEIGGLRYQLKPKERAAIHRNYALPRHFKKDKDPVPSVVDLLTGHRVLSVRDKRAAGALAVAEL